MPKPNSLSVVLPCYNEETNIETTVKDCVFYLKNQNFPFEIIVVDDGSTDATLLILQTLANSHPEIKILSHPKNLGYGCALRSGFDACEKEWIFLMDSDGQFNITELTDFFPHCSDGDIIIGFRSQRAERKLREFYQKIYNILIRKLFSLPFQDIGCAFKLFRRDIWALSRPTVTSDHKIFTVEWLKKARQKNFRIKELPVVHYPRRGGRATGARLDVILKTFWSLLKLYRQKNE